MTSPVIPYPEILPEQELVGTWESIEARTMDIAVRVSTFRGKSRKKSIAEYHISRVPLPPNSIDAVAAWRFDKTLPDIERYTVILQPGGKLACDCKHATLSNLRDTTLCVHQSIVATLADTFKEVVLPMGETK